MLVDTSVWIDHLRHRNSRLAAYLGNGEVETHPFVVGELACGNLRRRDEILSLLRCLPEVTQAEHGEVLSLVESKRLAGRGLGWVDAHLLAAALLHRTALWTLDRRLAGEARRLGVLFDAAS